MTKTDNPKEKKGTRNKPKSRSKAIPGKIKKRTVGTRRVKTPGKLKKEQSSRQSGSSISSRQKPPSMNRKLSESRKQRVSTAPRQQNIKSESISPTDLKWVEDDPKDHLLSRFIYDKDGKVIGESIGVEGRQLIMKSGKKFYSVPLRNIKEGENELTVKGRINKARARKVGEVWRKKALDPLYQKKK